MISQALSKLIDTIPNRRARICLHAQILQVVGQTQRQRLEWGKQKSSVLEEMEEINRAWKATLAGRSQGFPEKVTFEKGPK